MDDSGAIPFVRVCERPVDWSRLVTEVRHLMQLVEAFQSSPYLPLRTIQITLHDDFLMLDGSVPTVHCKQVAQSLAEKSLSGQQIQNRIQVNPSGRKSNGGTPLGESKAVRASHAPGLS